MPKADDLGAPTRPPRSSDESLFLARLGRAAAAEPARSAAAPIPHAEARRPARRTGTGEYVPLCRAGPGVVGLAGTAAAETLLGASALALPAATSWKRLQSAHVYRCRTGHATSPRRRALRYAPVARGIAGRRRQPGAGAGRGGRRRGRARSLDAVVRQQARGAIALLGGARRVAADGRQRRRATPTQWRSGWRVTGGPPLRKISWRPCLTEAPAFARGA